MNEYATDTSEDIEKDLPPLKVEVTNKEKELKNPTSEDTEEYPNYTPTDQEIKEMTDAQ